jgi:hypothetical protein
MQYIQNDFITAGTSKSRRFAESSPQSASFGRRMLPTAVKGDIKGTAQDVLFG